MAKLEEDINQAMEIVKCSDFFNEYDNMQKYSRIYQNTTENIKEYMPFLDGSYKRALLPTSSGDHQLEAILNGITEITCFDINRLSRYFTELKFAAIKNLSKKEFLNFMYEDIFNINVFNYLKDSLKEDVLIFWQELFKNCSIENIVNNLFRYLGFHGTNKSIVGVDFSKYCAMNFTNYLEDNNYKFLQNRLENIKIKYLEEDLANLANSLNDKYDLINLTNIYEYVNSQIFYNDAQKFTQSIINLIPHLNLDGKMLITYLYRCHLADIKRYGKTSILYAKLLGLLENNVSIKILHDEIANKKGHRTLMDKLYAFRNVQFIKYLKDLNINYYELNPTGLGCGLGFKDVIAVYQKKL